MLELTQLTAYMMALAVAAAIPGPGMTALIARSVSGGASSGFLALAGLIIGDLTYLSLAVFGLAVIAHHYSHIFILISWGAALYLLWLSWQFWRYHPEQIDISKKAERRELYSAFLSGLTITLSNPKVIAFYMAILPLVISLDAISWQIWALILVPVTAVILVIVGTVFILGALKIRSLLTDMQAQRLLFRSAGAMMFLAAISMIFNVF